MCVVSGCQATESDNKIELNNSQHVSTIKNASEHTLLEVCSEELGLHTLFFSKFEIETLFHQSLYTVSHMWFCSGDYLLQCQYIMLASACRSFLPFRSQILSS